MKGVCIDVDHSALLGINEEYFLFPAKPNHYYVSKFNRKEAHFGCYPAERFQVVEKENWTSEPQVNTPNLDKGLLYRAQLIWRTKGYKNKQLKDYIIRPKGNHCFFWHDRELKKLCGCFPIHWFANFEELSEAEEVKRTPEPEPVSLLERPDGQLAFF
ncbi:MULTISPECIES: hypothetical protein [Bacillus]|uniref:hypothetical protein n=1 Tax=Bacillus TaxID=1386 RepID=UPI00123E3A95|nr:MULTISPECIES: hypothetical protein [Bacillus]MCT6909208.1 hypothetical protein [Bacillus cereus]MCX2467324.1 hypothetical protein [Bacillus sp. AM01]UTO44848.1 hypothetical protein L7754_27295 [Bacillus cereus]